MEIKGILDKIRKEEKGKKEFFFALQIEPDLIKSAVWSIQATKIEVLTVGETTPWHADEELLGGVDISLSSAAHRFAAQTQLPEPNRVVLGLPQEWVDKDKILSEKAEILKEISQKLELDPIGFVITAEAVVHNLKNIEGIPPTAIFLGFGKTRITVILVNVGKIIGVKSVDRSGNLGADVAEGLSRFGEQGSFPARILLYDSSDNLEEARQELINYPWLREGINFLHLPKVEVLANDFDIKSVSLAGGQEIGGKIEIKPSSGISTLQKAENPKQEIKGVEKNLPNVEIKPEMTGFIVGKDITQESPPIIQEMPVISPKEKLIESKNIEPKPKKHPLSLPKIEISRIKFLLTRIKEKLSFLKIEPKLKPQLNFSGHNFLIFVIILVMLLILGGIFVSLWWYWPHAEIVLLIEPKSLEKEFTITLDPSIKTSDREKLIFPSGVIETTAGSEKTKETTGTKLVGEPAKGEVTIYNRTSNSKAFNSGEIITGPNNLKFSLDEKVTVASESAGPEYTRIPGKAKVKVTATSIGTEGNLASESEFSIGSFSKSDYIAKNESAFAGGTSREIQVVSKEDQERLVESLTPEIKSKGIEELKNKTPPDRRLIEESLVSKIASKEFDKNVGQEANELKLKLTLRFSALSYKEEELKEVIKEEILKTVSQDYEYKADQSEISFVLNNMTKEEQAILFVHVKANLFPKLDLEGIKKNLTGKQRSIGEAYLYSIPNVKFFEAKISPTLPDKIAIFPRLSKNIKIEVRVK